MIDNAGGFSINVNNKAQEYSGKLQVEASYNKFYGETSSPDCPQSGLGGFCYKGNKLAVMATTSFNGAKQRHPDMLVTLPYHK
jgi:hypothetical protein